jgi:predicted metal-dependent phosphotriesterase family hydrolase
MATAIETVVGPIAAIELSPSLMHEHIVTRWLGVQEHWPHLWDRPEILKIAERKATDRHGCGILTRSSPPSGSIPAATML